MNSEATRTSPALSDSRSANLFFDPDRIGVFASVLCAIHCAATPLIFLLLPTIGGLWAHPASHWALALIVVPIALVMMSKGYRRHGRRWILPVGIAGVLLVLAGAFFSYSVGSSDPVHSTHHVHEVAGSQSLGDESQGRHDVCCPSVIEAEDGGVEVSFSAASILTTAGGLLLVAIHLGNLCCRPTSRREPLSVS